MINYNIGAKIRGIVRNIEFYINRAMADLPISKGQFEYFIVIHQHEGLNQQELARLMNVGKTSVTKALKKLLEEGLVYRKVNERDHRNYGLYISEKGQPLVSFFKQVSGQISDTVLGDFKQHELDMLLEFMNRMSDNSQLLADSAAELQKNSLPTNKNS